MKENGLIIAPRTAKETIHFAGTYMGRMNMDINLTRNMPPVLPGEQGVQKFAQSLRQAHFDSLADAFQIVHTGELRLRRNRRFPTRSVQKKFEACRAVIKDLAVTVSTNSDMLNSYVGVGPTTYKGEDTKIGDLVLTFYEIVLKIPDNKYVRSVAMQRVKTLGRQEGFVLSPMMKTLVPAVETGK